MFPQFAFLVQLHMRWP